MVLVGPKEFGPRLGPEVSGLVQIGPDPENPQVRWRRVVSWKTIQEVGEVPDEDRDYVGSSTLH